MSQYKEIQENPDVQSGSGPSDNVDRPWMWQSGVWRVLPVNAVRGVAPNAWFLTYTAWFHDEQTWDTYYFDGPAVNIPEDIESNIVDEISKSLCGDRSKLLNYFTVNKLKTLTENIGDF